MNGSGVPSVEDALINMELQPMHQALRSLLDQDTVRLLADLAEHPRGNGVGVTDRKLNRKRNELSNIAWSRCEAFLREAQQAYRSRTGRQVEMTMPGLLGPAFRARLGAAMRIPIVEALFPAPWTGAARRVLPSPSPQLTATAMWGPVFTWSVLETLAESVDAENPEKIALEIFDRLRLREPIAEAFNALGFEGEAGWHAAARIKIVLLSEAGVAEPAQIPPSGAASEIPNAVEEEHVPSSPKEVGAEATKAPDAVVDTKAATVSGSSKTGVLSVSLWDDPDVRWLTGVHTAGVHTYFVCEPYEELVWWMQMPALVRLAAEITPSKAKVGAMNQLIQKALLAASESDYQLDKLLDMTQPKPAATTPGAAEVSDPLHESDEGKGKLDSKSAGKKSEEDVPINPRR
jgi:hypothetical protein